MVATALISTHSNICDILSSSCFTPHTFLYLPYVCLALSLFGSFVLFVHCTFEAYIKSLSRVADIISS